MTADPAIDTASGVSSPEVDAVLAACRVLVALSARSIAAVDELADPTEVRALVILASTEPLSLTALADAAGLHPSTASRLCDRLVRRGLLDRSDDPANRRALNLRVTDQGRRVVAAVVRHRRAAITPMLKAMPPGRREDLVVLLREFARAGVELADHDLWSMGWLTT